MAARHHFVTQGFLRGFAFDSDRNFVWVYDKRAGRRPKPKSIKAIAWQQDYYAQENPDGSVNEAVERALANGVDNNAPRIIRSINPRPGDRVSLTADECAELALFVGLSLTRVPSFRDGIDETHAHLGEIMLSLAAEKDPKLRAAIEKFGIQAEALPSASLEPMVASAKQVAHSLMGKSWQFYVAPTTTPLATSDNPVIFSGGYAGLSQIGPAHPGAEVVMNLRSDLALVCTPRDKSTHLRTYLLSPFASRKFTRGVVRAARHRAFYSRRCDSFEALVKKYPDEGQRVFGR